MVSRWKGKCVSGLEMERKCVSGLEMERKCVSGLEMEREVCKWSRDGKEV